MTKYFFLLVSACFFATVPSFSKPLVNNIFSESALVLDADTGEVIYEKAADKKQYPASTTKLLTALTYLELKEQRLNEEAVAEQDQIGMITLAKKAASKYQKPAYWIELGGTHISLQRGEKLSTKDLMAALLLSSANDAANVLAAHASGSVLAFCDEMNRYAKALGMRSSNFSNPHGLYHPQHYTTARDFSKVALKAFKNRHIRSFAKTVFYTIPASNLSKERSLVTGNGLLKKGRRYYPYAIGLKTGFHSKTRHCIVAAAEKNNRAYIVVLLNCQKGDDMYRDATLLFEAAFAKSSPLRQQKEQELIYLTKGLQDFLLEIPGRKNPVRTYIEEDLVLKYTSQKKPNVRAELQWKPITLPVRAGDHVGDIHVYDKDTGKKINSVELKAHKP